MLEKCELSVGQDRGDFTGNTNTVIQAAVNMAAELGGGTVNILPGKYIMNDSLHLKPGVTVRGTGTETVLWKPPSMESRIIYFLGYGHYDIAVAEPDRFQIGAGIYVTDDKAGGFYSTVAAVNWKRGCELGLTHMLNGDILLENNGIAVSVYPVISGCNLRNAAVHDLVVEGNASENGYLNGCVGGGIYLRQAHNVVISEVTVRNFNGDGISFQQCKNTIIEKCRCIGNTGHGLHPGSGSAGSVLRGVECRENGRDGIFYCLRVSYTLCENCLLESNKGHGISIGHRDTDNIIKGNRIANNGKCGIYFREDELRHTGHRTLIDGNRFDGNCGSGGNAEIVFDSFTCNVFVLNNIFMHRSPVKGAKPAICVRSAQEGLVIHNNVDDGEFFLEAARREFNSGISFEGPSVNLQIGPGCLPETACLHLGLQE